MKVLNFLPAFIVHFILFIRRQWSLLVFKYRLAVVINRCAKKHANNTAKGIRIVRRWYASHEHKMERELYRKIVEISWKTGRLIDDIEKEIS